MDLFKQAEKEYFSRKEQHWTLKRANSSCALKDANISLLIFPE
jgi:hypothetical protein